MGKMKIASFLLVFLVAGYCYGRDEPVGKYPYEPFEFEPQEFQPFTSKAIRDKFEAQWGIEDKDWPRLRNAVADYLTEDKAQALEEFYTGEWSFDPVEVAGFYGFVMDETAHLIRNYEEEISEGDLVIFAVPYAHQEVIRITQFVEKNAGKIGMIVVGWDDQGMNNFDNRDLTTYPQVAENYERVYAFCKIQAPDVPIGFTVSISPGFKDWIESFKVDPDFLALWNIYNPDANLAWLKKNIPGYQLFLLSMNAQRPKNRNESAERYQAYCDKRAARLVGGPEYEDLVSRAEALEVFKGLSWRK